jgi:hypothetical protein
MNSLGEKLGKQESFGFKGLSLNTQRLILEQVQREFEGVPLHKLPVAELRRLRDEVFKGKSFSHAIFTDPVKALKHIRGALSEEITLRTPSRRELARHTGSLLYGLDMDDVANNLELIRSLGRK